MSSLGKLSSFIRSDTIGQSNKDFTKKIAILIWIMVGFASLFTNFGFGDDMFKISLKKQSS